MNSLDLARLRLLWATTEATRARQAVRSLPRTASSRARLEAQERHRDAREAVRLAREAVEVELGREG